MDECDLSTEEKEELKREICNICVISMDRILECINYKRPEIQLGWWNKDAEEKILNFITSVSIFLYIFIFYESNSSIFHVKYFTDYFEAAVQRYNQHTML